MDSVLGICFNKSTLPHVVPRSLFLSLHITVVIMVKTLLNQLVCVVLLVQSSDAVSFRPGKDVPLHQLQWLGNKPHPAQPRWPPTSGRVDGQSSTVKRLKNANFIRNGPAAKNQAFSKYGWDPNATPTSTLARPTANVGRRSAGMRKRQGEVGTVQATPQQFYSEYLSPVTIGGQTLMIDFGMICIMSCCNTLQSLTTTYII